MPQKSGSDVQRSHFAQIKNLVMEINSAVKLQFSPVKRD
jgi:hypothetical protein